VSAKQKKTGTTKYRYVGVHVADMDGGMPLAPGDYIELDPVDATGTAQHLLADGLLIDASDIAAPTPTTEETPA